MLPHAPSAESATRCWPKPAASRDESTPWRASGHRRAARRVSVAAGRGGHRAEASCATIETELVEGVIDLQRGASAHRRAARRRRLSRSSCPFKGLAAVRARRRRILLRAGAACRGDRRAAGRGGAPGRSWVRRAAASRRCSGPDCSRRFRAGILPGSDQWSHLTPAARRPSAGRAGRRARRRPRAAVCMIVAVDQFEEAFTACRGRSERARVPGRGRRCPPTTARPCDRRPRRLLRALRPLWRPVVNSSPRITPWSAR